MNPVPIQIQMLGEFSLRNGSCAINDSDNRSRKVWLLLAYMIYCRNRPTTPDELITLLWGEEERSSNPINALKTMSHRVRLCLNQLGDSAGHDLILRRDGSYIWNPEVPVTVDIDDFDALCRAGADAAGDEERLECWLKALSLYHGDFLAKLSSELWVVPISTYYHNLFVQTALETLHLLEEQARWEESAQLCRSTVEQEPYMEEFYRHLMTALIRLGDQKGAARVYEDMSELFLANFGVMPSDEARSLYREAIRDVNDHTVPPGIILEQLREPSGPNGALFCDYDVFKSIYHSFARSVARSGDAVHLALITITGDQGEELARRSLDRVIVNLQELIRSGLRRGDIASRCSVSQFILLLPQANFENTQMVCQRIVKAFFRQYPHTPARLHVSVHPLEPNP